MRKRFGLLILGVLICTGAFLLYQFVTGAGLLAPPSAPADQFVGPVDLSLVYENRDPVTGALRYVITAKSVNQVLDAQGHPVPGEVKAVDPDARFYQKDGRVLELHADTCRAVLDQMPKHSGGGADAEMPPFQPRVATLSGHVRVMIGGKPPGPGPARLQDAAVAITFDGDVTVLPNQNLLSTPGKVHVRSLVDFDARGLALSYNRDEQRIEYLRFDEGDTIIVRDAGKRAFALDTVSPAGQAASTVPGPATAPAGGPGTRPAAGRRPATAPAGGPPPTTYKLSFGQNVSATIGGRSLTADRLYALFVGSVNAAKDEKISGETSAGSGAPGEAAAGTTAAGPAGSMASAPSARGVPAPAATAPASGAGTASVAPIAPAGPDDLVIHWTGAMEMRPAGPQDLVLAGPKDFALQAVGTRENPVRIHDGDRSVIAGGFWYHLAEDRVEIEPGELAAVELGDPAMGKIVCKGVSFLRPGPVRQRGSVKLVGPATVEVPQSALRRDAAARGATGGPPLRLAFAKGGTFDFDNIADPANPKKTVQAIRHAILSGDVLIQDVASSLSADELDILLSQRTPERSAQALEHLLATGHVEVKSARSGAALADKPEGLDADKLELSSELHPGRALPTLSRALATGNVVAWNYAEQKASDENGSNAAGRAGEKRLVRQSIQTAKLDAVLGPRDRSTPAPDADSLALGGGSDVKSLVATGGVTIELEGFQGSDNKAVIATAQTLTVDDPKSGHATLEGDLGLDQVNGVAKPVLVTMGENRIIGSRLLIDQKSRRIEIPGKGTFVFAIPIKKPDEVPTKLQVDWTQGMTYDDKAKVATFNGLVTAERLGRADQISTLHCRQLLQVQLATREAAAAGEPAPAGPAGARKSPIASLLARGDVEAEGRQLDPAGNLLTRVYLHTAEVRYTDASEFLDIPYAGSMLVEDYRPEKPGAKPDAKAPSARGRTAFHWADKLTFDGKAGLLTMAKDVVMVHQPVKPFRLPVDKSADAKPITEATLHGDVLTARLISSKDAAAGAVSSPIDLGSGSDVKIADAKAQGNARLDLGTTELTGYSLEYDDLKKIATAMGKGEVDAYVVRPNQGLLAAEQIVWDVTKPDEGAFTLIHQRGTFTPN